MSGCTKLEVVIGLDSDLLFLNCNDDGVIYFCRARPTNFIKEQCQSMFRRNTIKLVA